MKIRCAGSSTFFEFLNLSFENIKIENRDDFSVTEWRLYSKVYCDLASLLPVKLYNFAILLWLIIQFVYVSYTKE